MPLVVKLATRCMAGYYGNSCHPWKAESMVGNATNDTSLSLPQPSVSVQIVVNMRALAKHRKISSAMIGPILLPHF